MLEKFMLAISLATTGIWLPYDHQIKPKDKAEEYYASVTVTNASGIENFTDRSFADKMCCYTNREVMAYYLPNDYTPKKFYYTYDSTHPIIHYIVPLNNDLKSVSFALGILEEKSRLGGVGLTSNDLNNISLGYLRSFRKDYSGDKGTGDEAPALGWGLLAGDCEPVKNSWTFMESKIKYHDSTRDFFARYAENKRYYSEKHGTTSASIGWKNSITTLPDPCGEGNIDLIHMFASIDGALKYTFFKSTEEAGVLLFPGKMNHDILGWGGDLQSCMQDKMISTIQDALSFSKILFYKDSRFSNEDFLADIDAFNIAKLCDSGLTLHTAFVRYYQSLKSNHSKRYSDFIDNVIMEKTFKSWTGTKEELFRKEVHMMLAQQYTTDGNQQYTTDGYQDIYNDITKKTMFHLIGYETYDLRYKVAELFASYVLGKINMNTREDINQ